MLFSGPMVRALLSGAKTQTRRLVKPAPQPPFQPLVSFNHGRAEVAFGPSNRDPSGIGPKWWRPPTQPGDTLWVRETWGMNHCQYERGPIPKVRPADFDQPDAHYLAYQATETDTEIVHELRWRPSIHMPRWASRISLSVSNVRVEQLQEITDADAEAEGIREPSLGDTVWFGFVGLPRPSCPAKTAFANLWMEIHGVESWEANPWVWVIDFEAVDDRA